MDQVALGRRLVAARERAGLTQEEVAEALRCHKSRISKWEHGHRLLKVEDLRDLADIYHCSVDVLLDESQKLDVVGRNERWDGPMGEQDAAQPPRNHTGGHGPVDAKDLLELFNKIADTWAEDRELARLDRENERLRIERVEATQAEERLVFQRTLERVTRQMELSPYFSRSDDEARAGKTAENE